MAMQINTNILSMAAQRNVGMNESRLGTAIERLSTGLRINSARDDAAGMAISERFTSQIRGQTVAQRNANDAISLAQTAEGALGVLGDALQRMRELTVQSLNGMNTVGDRAAIQQEIVQLREEIERIAQDTTFNGKELLNGSLGTMNFQIGSERGDVLGISGLDARATSLGSRTETVIYQNSVAGAIDYTAGYDDVFINGVGVDLTSASSQSQIISRINAVTEQTGVTASAETRVDLGAFTAGTGGTLSINNQSITVAGTDDVDSLVETINGTEGIDVVASVSAGGNLVLTSASGEDIALSQTGGVGAAFGLLTTAGDSETYVSSIKLSASGSDPITVSGTDAVDLRFTTGGGATELTEGQTIANVSVATVAEGNDALDTIDAAIDQITSLRAELGALQNRFENVVEVISVHRENLEAARSRIMDADFAAETANLTRAQILQQAGISSLAQANSAPQSVLSLLQ